MIGAKRRMAARALAMGAMAAGVLAAGALAGSVPGMAQSPSLSDESVLKLMEYAWQQTPPRFTKPDAKVVEIDKKKIALADPIRALGEYTVRVSLFENTFAAVKVVVEKD